MEKSIQFAKETISNLRNSVFYGRSGYYAQMDAESENEDDAHSLFYSVHQSDHINEDSIPLTLSNAYSDRSQLLFEQDDSESEESSGEENLKPSSIYLDQPESSKSIAVNPSSLSESLLPTASTIPPGITMMDRKYKDPVFFALYGLSCSAFVLSGIIILFTTNSHSVEGFVKESIFKVIKDSAGMLATVIGTSLVIATLWLFILRNFAKLLVWSTVICVPVVLTTCFIWSLVESLQSTYVYEGNEKATFKDTALTWLSIIPLVLNLIYIKSVYSSRHRISKTVAVIELACEVLRSNPAIFIVPISLLTTFICFTSIWIAFFNRLWLIGHLSGPSVSKTVWIVNNYVYYIAAFYVFFYMWTSMLLIYLEKFALSGMTAQWYFHRNNTTNSSISIWKSAMARGLTTSFGTIALAGFLMAIIHFLQFLTNVLKKFSKKSGLIGYILRFLEPFISTVNHYTVGLSGITGENFFSAAKSATKIFRRNLLSGAFGDLLTQMILHVGTGVIALTSGLSAYVYATHQLHSPHGFIVGLIGTLMPYYISQFYSYTMVSM
ncbi:unnamed protein product [Rhizopus stolonifer]